MASRREFAATLAGGSAALSGGCIGFLLGNEPLSFAASKAEVSRTAVNRAGYRHVTTDPVRFTKEFTVQGVTRTVEVTNYVARYASRVQTQEMGMAEAAVFATLVTPQVDIAGQVLNPLGELPKPAIVQRAQDVYSGLRVEETLEAASVTILEGSRQLARFAALAQLAGNPINLLLHLAQFQHAGDFLFALGTHPRALSQEARNVALLASAINHG